MRIAALYDVHGNLPALEAVLAEITRERVDLIVFGGDLVLGPLPRETFTRVQAIDTPCRYLTGNCDREMLAQLDGRESPGVPPAFLSLLKWSGEQLAAEQIAIVRRWPATVRVTVDGLGDVLFVHATPRNDTEIFLKTTDETRLVPIFESTGAALVVCGHTHMPFDRRVGRVRVVNAGSVGMSFAGPGACWLLIDGPDVQLRRTPYDVDAAAARVRASTYPKAEEFAATNVLQTPDEGQMLITFSARELTG